MAMSIQRLLVVWRVAVREALLWVGQGDLAEEVDGVGDLEDLELSGFFFLGGRQVNMIE